MARPGHRPPVGDQIGPGVPSQRALASGDPGGLPLDARRLRLHLSHPAIEPPLDLGADVQDVPDVAPCWPVGSTARTAASIAAPPSLIVVCQRSPRSCASHSTSVQLSVSTGTGPSAAQTAQLAVSTTCRYAPRRSFPYISSSASGRDDGGA